jgi:hypothetical protein
MLSENHQKTYTSTTNQPLFTWAFSLNPAGREQHFGMNWVVSMNPQTGNDPLRKQEPLNRNLSDVVVYPANVPLFSRPASQHGGGMHVVFCGGNARFLREDIDYTVYQRLLTTKGSKCVDPVNHANETGPAGIITQLRRLAPLSSQDLD